MDVSSSKLLIVNIFVVRNKSFRIVTGHGCDPDPSHIAATAIRNEEKQLATSTTMRRDATDSTQFFRRLKLFACPNTYSTDAQAACQAENWKRLYENIPVSNLKSMVPVTAVVSEQLVAQLPNPLQRRRLLAVSEDNLNSPT
uniref:Uncharacterized protein n=1 Tax=Ditylenchus dipsaci TaxID=166011 RepID=A0A915DKP5_9BILA